MKETITQKISQKGSLFFLLGILLIGLLTLPSYGAYLDQTNEQMILFANIKEYLMHLPGEEPALVQELTDFGILPVSIYEDRDHGMAIYYPAFAVWYLNQRSPYAGSLFFHVYTLLINFWGICSLFLFVRDLFGSGRLAGFVTLLYVLTPRMFAEIHYNNKDVVLLSLTFTLFYWAGRLMREKSVKCLVMFAFVGALAANMKIIGAWIFGVLGLYALIYLIAKKEFDKGILVKVIACIALWAVLWLLMTPASWGNLKGFLSYLFWGAVDYNLWHDWVLFDGRMVHQDYTGMPRKYLPVLMLYTIPVGISALCVAGGLLALADSVKSRLKDLEKSVFVLVILAVGAVPLLYAVLAATPLYNGWRHFYFVYASLMIGLGYGAYRIWKAAEKRGLQKWTLAVAGIYMAALAAGIACNYPQEHSYYNLLAGENVGERFELDYWDMSVNQAFDAILSDKADGETIVVGAPDLTTWWGLEENWKFLPAAKRDRLILAEYWEEAEYVIVNNTYSFMYSQDAWERIKADYVLTDTFTSYGNVICEVYRR